MQVLSPVQACVSGPASSDAQPGRRSGDGGTAPDLPRARRAAARGSKAELLIFAAPFSDAETLVGFTDA